MSEALHLFVFRLGFGFYVMVFSLGVAIPIALVWQVISWLNGKPRP